MTILEIIFNIVFILILLGMWSSISHTNSCLGRIYSLLDKADTKLYKIHSECETISYTVNRIENVVKEKS